MPQMAQTSSPDRRVAEPRRSSTGQNVGSRNKWVFSIPKLGSIMRMPNRRAVHIGEAVHIADSDNLGVLPFMKHL
jgi:hypothetical protein